jgi:hypothetical protein
MNMLVLGDFCLLSMDKIGTMIRCKLETALLSSGAVGIKCLEGVTSTEY